MSSEKRYAVVVVVDVTRSVLRVCSLCWPAPCSDRITFVELQRASMIHCAVFPDSIGKAGSG